MKLYNKLILSISHALLESDLFNDDTLGDINDINDTLIDNILTPLERLINLLKNKFPNAKFSITKLKNVIMDPNGYVSEKVKLFGFYFDKNSIILRKANKSDYIPTGMIWGKVSLGPNRTSFNNVNDMYNFFIKYIKKLQ